MSPEQIEASTTAQLAAQFEKRLREIAANAGNEIALRKWCVEHATEKMTPHDIFRFVTAPLAELLKEQ